MKNFFNDLYNKSILNRGLSVYIMYSKKTIISYSIPNYKSGYIVSNDKYTQKIPFGFYEPKDLENYAKKYRALLDGGYYMLGVWINDGVVYLDISMYFNYVYNAIDYLNANNQKAFYDIKQNASFDAYLNKVE